MMFHGDRAGEPPGHVLPGRPGGALLSVLVATGLMLGSLGMLRSAALDPLWRMQDTSLPLHRIRAVNPFTHAVESIRSALHGRFNVEAVLFVLMTFGVLLGLAICGCNPARGMMSRKNKFFLRRLCGESLLLRQA